MNQVRDLLTSLYSLDEMVALRSNLKDEGKSVTFTNGVFDLIHPGHVGYLNEAKSQGDYLIVGLNSDSSVRRLNKGASRPINDQRARAMVLLGLKAVDAVVIFDDETPLSLIEAIQPDVLVKGGDYTLDQIVGAKEVQAYGGEVKQLSFLDGYSTTAIEEKIQGLK